MASTPKHPCLDAQTKLTAVGLTSETAHRFIEQLPTLESLMPRLSFQEIAGEADPPIADNGSAAARLRGSKQAANLEP